MMTGNQISKNKKCVNMIKCDRIFNGRNKNQL